MSGGNWAYSRQWLERINNFGPPRKPAKLSPYQYSVFYTLTDPAQFLITSLIRLKSNNPLLRTLAADDLQKFANSKPINTALK